jgi:RNA exonuclease 1
VLMDELVKPELPITDYVTAFSGITHAMLENVETRLEDVQRTFLELVDAETLLVGHALENDLRAMRVIHANIIDTSIMFPHPKVRNYKLQISIHVKTH